jgi:tetratricopeptide (TPR) repeat protein
MVETRQTVDDAARESQLGRHRYIRGDFQRAIAHFTAALKLDPDNPRLYAERGDAFRLNCEYERAIADLTAALQIEPKSLAALVSRAIAWQCSGSHNHAVEDASVALDLDPNNAAAYRIRAAAHTELNSEGLALADLTRVIDLSPGDDEAYYQRGLIHGKNGDVHTALGDFDKVLLLNPYHIAARFARGNAHGSRKGYSQAILDYTEVLRLHPSHVGAYVNRAMVYRRHGEPARAIADLSEALRLDPASTRNYCQRGILYRARGDLTRAEADFDEAVRLNPDHWAARYHRAKVALATGRLSAAASDLDEVLRLNPKYAGAYLSRALARHSLGLYQEAIADSSCAVQLEPRSVPAYLVRGVILTSGQEFSRAIDDLTWSIQLAPSVSMAYLERSLAFTLKGEYARALEDCERSIALDAGNAEAYIRRSIIYHVTGHMDRALADYSKALQMDPFCVLASLDEHIASTGQRATTRRLADFIDGLLPEARVVATHAATSSKDPTAPGTRAVANKDEAAAPAQPAALGSSVTKRALAPELIKKTEASPDETATGVEATVSEQLVERVVDEVLGASPEAGTQASEVKNSFPNEEDPARSQAKLNPVMCPLCRRVKAPAENLPDGRVRCGACRALFLPSVGSSAFAKPASAGQPARKPARKSLSDDEDGGFFQKWRKSLPVAAAGIVILAVLFLGIPMHLLGKTNRVSVYPARGAVQFQGRPLPNASLFLYPVGVNTPEFPLPRATVRDDGTFTLGTYGPDDGAPAGEYKVTVQWFPNVADPEKDDGVVPQNQLPPKYARAETSGLSLRITEGENTIPPFQLNR